MTRKITSSPATPHRRSEESPVSRSSHAFLKTEPSCGGALEPIKHEEPLKRSSMSRLTGTGPIA